jgi:hypothetical protein
MSLYRAAIRPMPDNPAGDVAGDTSGLWKVVVYKRRGEYVENEELIETPGEEQTTGR